MYEDIRDCCPEWEHQVVCDPKSCTNFCRKLVIAFWVDFVRRRYIHMLTTSELSSVNPNETGYVSRTGWLQHLDFLYEENIFGSLINARHKQASLLREICANMRALGLPPLENHVCGENVQDAWERHGWNEVWLLTNHITEMMNLFTQSY